MANAPWHARSSRAVLTELQSNPSGLTQAEVQRRVQEYGPNRIREQPPPSLLQRIGAQLSSFVVWILIGAAGVSLFLGEYVDGAAILTIIALNAVLGVVQESKAEAALAALRRMTAPHTKVLRDGQTVSVESWELVPGDLVIIEAGDTIPADLRLLETASFKVDEAPLTGESVPVEKHAEAELDAEAPLADRTNMAYMGTACTYGRARGVVVATGMETEIGRIAARLQAAPHEDTPLQKKLDLLGKRLGAVMLLVSAAVGVLGILRGMGWLEVLMTAVSLAVAAVPEGLPAVVTVVLALGTQRMVRRHAIIRRLAAVETLGATTVICSDKTGTLTQNQMTVTRLWAGGRTVAVTGEGYATQGEFHLVAPGQEETTDDHGPATGETSAAAGETGPAIGMEALLRYAALCNDARLSHDEDGRPAIVGDPTEGALLVAAAKAGMDPAQLPAQYPRVGELPFDSERKRMTTIHTGLASQPLAVVKGAPDVLLARCTHIRWQGKERPLTPDLAETVRAANQAMAGEALRVLAVAVRPLPAVPEHPTPEDLERELTFVGLIGMMDPPRPEAIEAVATCRRAGMRPVMITGDHLDTAVAIALRMGITEDRSRALPGSALDRLSEAELDRTVREVDVYARVSPDHKVRIVEALQRQGQIVAMTGDGVNDALALKKADIGVAMGITGTEVAKGTADMVLTDDNFASIVAAVGEGRTIFDNIQKFVYFLLSANVAEIILIFVAMVLGWPLPLLPIHLLWLNLISDSLPALALGLEEAEPGTMDRPPRDPAQSIIDRPLGITLLVQAVLIAGAVLVAFRLGMDGFFGRVAMAGTGEAVARTMAFATISLGELWWAHGCRSQRLPVSRLGLFTNRAMWGATVAGVLLLLGALHLPVLSTVFGAVPLTGPQWAWVVGLSVLPTVVAEALEASIHRRD